MGHLVLFSVSELARTDLDGALALQYCQSGKKQLGVAWRFWVGCALRLVKASECTSSAFVFISQDMPYDPEIPSLH